MKDKKKEMMEREKGLKKKRKTKEKVKRTNKQRGRIKLEKIG